MAGEPMSDEALRFQLLERRERLQEVIHQDGGRLQFEGLLKEVDAALKRFQSGTFGVCQVCSEAIENDRLAVNPLITNCLDCLTDSERRNLEIDLERAAQIQNGLLPARDLVIPGWGIHYHYQPAGAVSGDFIDLIPPATAGGNAFFLLGDISGKGVSASILMSHLQAIFRGLVRAGEPLADIAATANRMFCESTLPAHFATVVCGLAGRDGTVELLGAGHCASLLRSAGEVKTLPAEGLPMGLFCEGGYATRTMRLEPGDALVLFSDGLMEARNSAGEEYGLKRIAGRLQENGHASAEEIIRRYIDDVAAYRAASSENDDLTIMALMRTA